MRQQSPDHGASASRDALVPIDEVARQLGLRASAIRYYEDRDLVTPVSRHAGRRWYGPAEIRKLAVIRYWQQYGLMSLDEIREVLAGSAATRDWPQIVAQRIEALRLQVERMETAREHLEHVLSHHRDSPPDGCRHFEEQLFGARLPSAYSLGELPVSGPDEKPDIRR